VDICSDIAVTYDSKETAYLSAIANVRQLAYDLFDSCDNEVKEVMKK
jgi:spermidine/putrescine-binding protein